MTFMHFDTITASVATIPVLTSHSSFHSNPGGLAHAGFAFDTDGTLYDVGPGALDRTLLDADEWWPNRPVTGIGSSYDVRCESIVGLGQSWDFQPAAVGTWITITEERAWRVTVTAMDAPVDDSVFAIFEIRKTGGDGTVLATAQLNATASN